MIDWKESLEKQFQTLQADFAATQSKLYEISGALKVIRHLLDQGVEIGKETTNGRSND